MYIYLIYLNLILNNYSYKLVGGGLLGWAGPWRAGCWGRGVCGRAEPLGWACGWGGSSLAYLPQPKTTNH